VNKVASTFEYSKPFPDKSFGVVINGAGEALHREITGIMADNFMSSDNYRMAKDSGAFFQGGHAGGDWIFIEFWANNLKHREFTEHLRDVFLRHHPAGTVSGLERLPEVPADEGPHRPCQQSGPPRKVVAVFRKIAWHETEVLSSLHAVPIENARTLEALTIYGEKILEAASKEFIKQFPEFESADWRYQIFHLNENDL
jgi:hypothetical protein